MVGLADRALLPVLKLRFKSQTVKVLLPVVGLLEQDVVSLLKVINVILVGLEPCAKIVSDA